MATMGIMAHELGHDIDWPDLYDTDGSSEGVGNWSIMGSGNWTRSSTDAYSGQTPVLPDAFLKWYQGWITPIQQTFPQSGVAIQSSADHPTAYLLGANPGGVDWDFDDSSGTGEYFLVENRQLVGFDAGLWRIDSAGNAKGCLIWHIDETRTYDNKANATETRKLVDLEEADGPPQAIEVMPEIHGQGAPMKLLLPLPRTPTAAGTAPRPVVSHSPIFQPQERAARSISREQGLCGPVL